VVRPTGSRFGAGRALAFGEVLREFVTDRGLAYLDVRAGAGPFELGPDLVHPNDVGHRWLAGRVSAFP
jgi:hypothetical protein